MAQVTLDSVGKTYANGFTAIHDLSLEIEDGEFLVLVGPSGCGKSTALRMIADLESVTAGTLQIGERVVNDVQPKDRDIAMVFQNYALYPHMTVEDNIGFALKLAKLPKSERRDRVRDAARILELEAQLEKRPGQLSGGQRQRVAMGRAIVRKPAVFLMDEPLSNLDAKLRVQMRVELARLQDQLGVTTIYVTHDQVEAMTMGDRVAVLKDGYLQQVDAPQALYDHPANVFVAAFIGSPSMNLFSATLSAAAETRQLSLGPHHLTLDASVINACPDLDRYAGKEVIVGIRPEHLTRTPASADDQVAMTAVAGLVESLGSEILVYFEVDATAVDAGDPDAGDELAFDGMNAVARLDPSVEVRAGDTLNLAVDTSKLHFFDPGSGLAIG